MHIEFAVVVPAFNEEEALPAVLKKIKKHIPAGNIYVVDDGSTDATAEGAAREGIVLLRHSTNMGKGEALKTGFRAVSSAGGIDAVITLDGDGQHEPEAIPSLIARYRETGAWIVIGDRMGDVRSMPRSRRLSNRMSSWAVSRIAGVRIRDSQSGFRMIRKELLGRLDLTTRRFDTESEMLMKAGRLGVRIESVPIRTLYTGGMSKMRPFSDTFRFLKLFLRSLMW